MQKNIGLNEIRRFRAFQKSPAVLHYEMQPTHILDVLGGVESLDPNKTLEESNSCL